MFTLSLPPISNCFKTIPIPSILRRQLHINSHGVQWSLSLSIIPSVSLCGSSMSERLHPVVIQLSGILRITLEEPLRAAFTSTVYRQDRSRDRKSTRLNSSHGYI